MAVLKVIEVVGISADGWEAAARAAVARASRSVRHIESLEVLRCTAVVRQDKILEYHLRAKLTFRIEDGEEPALAVEAAETILAEPVAGDGEELPPLLERQLDEALEELNTDVRP
jgi:flavin-binding protein dodecin